MREITIAMLVAAMIKRWWEGEEGIHYYQPKILLLQVLLLAKGEEGWAAAGPSQGPG